MCEKLIRIAGLYYNVPKDFVIKVGEVFDMTPEPENPHDPRAIRIDSGGVKLGYVPKTETRFVHQNWPLVATVDSIEDSGQVLDIFLRLTKQENINKNESGNREQIAEN